MRTWKSRLIEPQFLFPMIALVVLAVIWGFTGVYLRTQRVDLERTAQVSTREILETYEAQVVRALDQIEQTLAVVTFAHDEPGSHPTLAVLARHELLPPDLLFTVSIVDRVGRVIETTGSPAVDNLAGRDYFEAQRVAGRGTFVGRPSGTVGADPRIGFSRRLQRADGSFDGAVLVDVDASYFVSGYEPGKMGEHGLLALVDLEGRFRARRSGESVGLDGHVDPDTLALVRDSSETRVRISPNAWDGTRRWTAIRSLYGLPLAVMAGLSVEEQLSIGARTARTYLFVAALISALAMTCLAILGRQAWLLMESRRRQSALTREHAERVEYLAYHDGLTGLPNRSLFTRLLSQAMQESRRYSHALAIAYIDLDHFKSVNDTLGHDAGDELLREVAARLNESVRDSDVVARLGGDEFVVLLPRIDSKRDAAAVASKILEAMNRTFTLAGCEVRVTASIGISLSPQHGLDEQSLKKHADIAMYEAKALGRNTFQFYEQRLDETTQVQFQRLLVG